MRWLSYQPLDSYGFWRRLTAGRTQASLRLDHPGFQLLIERRTWRGPRLSIELERWSPPEENERGRRWLRRSNSTPA